MAEKASGLWRIHTPNLLKEAVECNPSAAILRIPMMMLGRLLFEVGEEAARINDPCLNELMCRLTIYTCADPESPDYDRAKMDEVRRRATIAKATQKLAGPRPAQPRRDGLPV